MSKLSIDSRITALKLDKQPLAELVKFQKELKLMTTKLEAELKKRDKKINKQIEAQFKITVNEKDGGVSKKKLKADKLKADKKAKKEADKKENERASRRERV